ncbi:ParB-like nuclease domain protein [Gordonia phage Kuwabara]|nr:ParB-like nuclease domain protein [Gordonia phage Kuwabara]
MAKPARLELTSHLAWIRLDQMKLNPLAQRDFNPNNPAVAGEFDPEVMGYIVVSHRDGWYYIVDGQHRKAGALQYLGDSSQQIQCRVFEGLTSEQEAELFLMLNDQKKQDAMSKYKVSLTAGRARECDVERICRSLDLRIGRDKSCEEIACVSALLGVYDKHGPASFSFAMRVIRDSYGYDGFKRQTISAAALIKDRYGNSVDEEALISRLEKKGMVALNQAAKSMKEATGNPADQCYAHAMIQFYNLRNTKRVDPWWNLGVIGVA